jgi:hypothetical protein
MGILPDVNQRERKSVHAAVTDYGLPVFRWALVHREVLTNLDGLLSPRGYF